jgi:HlyD family secretion protein
MKARSRVRLWIALVIVLAAGIGAAAWALVPRVALADRQVPTARVERGDLEVNLNLLGDLLTGKSVTVTPPPAGVPLRLMKIVETGDVVHANDVVMAFDPADQEYIVDVNKSQLLEAEQEIIKLRANTEVQTAQQQTEILNAKFNVRRSEMDALTPAQFIGINEGKIRALSVTENKRRLAELEAAVASRQAVDRAALAQLEQRRNTARVTAERAEQIISQLEVRAPIDGSVVVRENRDNVQMFFPGMTLPEYRVGDTLQQGRVVMEIIDTSEVRIRARVSEQDRPSVAEGQNARVQANGRGGAWMPAAVESVAGLASRQESSSPIRRFDVTLRLTKHQPLLPGTSVRIVVEGKGYKDVLHVLRQAVFERDGEPIVYARENGRFVAKPVKIVGRTESRVALTGVAEGAELALLDPTASPEDKGGAKGTVLD